jgi:16S rRNA (guanine527-N7)-methyltransferase
VPVGRGESLRDWLGALLAVPGLTALADPARAHELLVDDALRALPLLERYPGPIVDVGSGGGSPGIPLAASLPEREVTLLEAQRRKCDFLERWAPPNARVVWGRAEEQPREAWTVALAKALASPPVAAEWCLPLVCIGGAALLWVGPSAELGRLARVAALLGGGGPEEHDGLVLLPKVEATPARFPRRPGIAKKRPLG